MADHRGQTGRESPVNRGIGHARSEHSHRGPDGALQRVADEDHSRGHSAQRAQDIGRPRVAAALLVDVDSMHSGDDHCEVDAPHHVGGHQRQRNGEGG